MRIKRSYNVGDKFRMSPDALENYGAQYEGKTFTVAYWCDHYAKPGSGDVHGHPGFDSAAGTAIYGSALNFDLYEWEMERV